jgi:glycosyltransferase involved in cell wall biosynthesis
VLKRRRLWPYLGVVDASGRGTGWCGLSGPLRQQSDLDTYDELRKRAFRFVGFTSYLTFPALTEGLLSDYGELCDGWCHCFRQPQDYISPEQPTALISESDFIDYRFISPREICGRDDPAKEFDFIYVCLPGPWAEMTKNWPLAKACLHHLCYDLDLRGLLLGRWQIFDLPFRHNLTVVGDMPRREVLQYLGRSRFVFVPSVKDASPRILAEALCMDVPILVNQEILGGWKYVDESTGAFFSSEGDLLRAAEQCLGGRPRPRSWFQANHGPMNAALRLSTFLHTLDDDIEPGVSLRLAGESVVRAPGAHQSARGARGGIAHPVWLGPPSALSPE